MDWTLVGVLVGVAAAALLVGAAAGYYASQADQRLTATLSACAWQEGFEAALEYRDERIYRHANRLTPPIQPRNPYERP